MKNTNELERPLLKILEHLEDSLIHLAQSENLREDEMRKIQNHLLQAVHVITESGERVRS